MSVYKTQRIFLIGPMGAGKSTIGRALALVMGKPFLDLDEEIVRKEGCSIPEIFKKGGEDSFRIIETRTLKDCLSFSAVIATGGGIVMREENLELLKDNGMVIYLYASVDVQYERTLNDNNRPMINTDDRRSRLEDIFSLRDPLYRKISDVIIDSGLSSVHECVTQITKLLR